MVKKNPRKRGLAGLTWAAQRDLFRDMSRRRRDRYAAAKTKPMIEATNSKKGWDVYTTFLSDENDRT